MANIVSPKPKLKKRTPQCDLMDTPCINIVPRFSQIDSNRTNLQFKPFLIGATANVVAQLLSNITQYFERVLLNLINNNLFNLLK